MTTQVDTLSASIPNLYYDGNSGLVPIVEEYYKWLDTHSVNLPSLRSSAEEKFVDLMVEEYAPGIDKTSNTNTRLLIKFATELFRAKGTPRAIDLFFRLVYHVNAPVSFPRERLFTPSFGTYDRPVMIEVTRSPHTKSFVNTYVVCSSGGTAFVEGVRKVGSKTFIIVTNVSGNFSVGASLYTTISTRVDAPTIVGSLLAVEQIEAADGFQVGTPITVQNTSGSQGYGYVSAVDTLGSQAEYKLVTGGAGVSPHPEITTSERTMCVEEIVAGNGTMFAPKTAIEQQLYAGVFDSIEGEFFKGDTVELTAYNEFEVEISAVEAEVIAVEQTQNAGGRLIMQTDALSANVLLATVVTSGNTVGTDMVVTDVTATANVVGASSNATLVFSTNVRPILIGGTVTQTVDTVESLGVIISVPTPNEVVIEITSGQFTPNTAVKDGSNNAILTPTDVKQFIGINDITNTFYPDGTVTCGNTAATASIVSDQGSSTVVVSKITNQRTVFTQTIDQNISALFGDNYLTLAATDYYGIPVGTITEVVTKISEDTLDYPPIASVTQPCVSPAAFSLTVDSTEGFEIGETVFQNGVMSDCFDVGVTTTQGFVPEMIVLRSGVSDGIGIVDYIDPATNTVGVRSAVGTWANTGSIFTADQGIGDVELADIVSVANSVTCSVAAGVVTGKTTTTLTVVSAEAFVNTGSVTGTTSGSTQEVTAATPMNDSNELAPVVSGHLSRIGGRISTVKVNYVEPGFRDNERVDLLSGGNSVGVGYAITDGLGRLQPTFTSDGSKPSSNHAIFDGRYYQHLSYTIKSPIDLDKYPTNKRFLQVAGMEMFTETEVSGSARQAVAGSIEIE